MNESQKRVGILGSILASVLFAKKAIGAIKEVLIALIALTKINWRWVMKKKCNECSKQFVISKQDYQERKNKLLDHGEMNLCVKHYMEARATVHEQSYFQNMGQ